MTDELTTPLTVEQMYGDWGVECDEAMALTDRSLNPRSKTSMYDALATLGLDVGERGFGYPPEGHSRWARDC